MRLINNCHAKSVLLQLFNAPHRELKADDDNLHAVDAVLASVDDGHVVVADDGGAGPLAEGLVPGEAEGGGGDDEERPFGAEGAGSRNR